MEEELKIYTHKDGIIKNVDEIIFEEVIRGGRPIMEKDLVFSEGRKVFTPSKAGERRLNDADRIFITHVANGVTLVDSFIKAYPERCINKGRKEISIQASGLLQRNNFKRELERQEKELNRLTVDKGLWTREMGIETLRGLIDTAQEEINNSKTSQAYKLSVLQAQLDEAMEKDDTELCQDLMEKISYQLTKKNLGRNTVTAIVESTKELNAMCGFDGDDISLADTVIFTDQYEIIDDPNSPDFQLTEEANNEDIENRIKELGE